MACTVVQYTHGEVVILKYTSIIMKFIVWIINDIHVDLMIFIGRDVCTQGDIGLP